MFRAILKMSEFKNPKYPGKRITTNGNQLVAAYTECLICDAGVFYPITPSTEQGENFQLQYAKGKLNAFGESFIAIEAEGEHAAQGGAIAISTTGKRVVNFTSGQGIVYAAEQYYHAPGKLSTMVVEVGARALTKHALNVHCGHDDIYAVLDTGWTILFAKNAQQASDQAIILRKLNELTLNPGLNCQDGMLSTHMEKTFFCPEPELIRTFLGKADDIIDCPTEAQRILFGAKRRRVPAMIDLQNPLLVGPVQNQEHYMNGVIARRNNFSESILDIYDQVCQEYAELTGRQYGQVSTYNIEKADTVFVCMGCAAENIEAAIDYLKETRGVEVGVLHVNILRPFPENALIQALKGKKNAIVIERTDEPLSPDNPLTAGVRIALSKAVANFEKQAHGELEKINPATEKPDIFSGSYGLGSRDFRPEGIIGAYDFATGKISRKDRRHANEGVRYFTIGIDHPYAVISDEKPSLQPEGAIAVRFHSIGGWGMITTGKNLGEILGNFSNYVADRDQLKDEDGNPEEAIHISANPKYGSEKKGAPTNYFLVAAKEQIKVNCDLKHVNVVLCCDPKVFLHTNPLLGLSEGGAFVWESGADSPESVWQHIPTGYRKEIIDKKIRVFALNGFDIARKATNREDLQTRMQGNSFLGAFFRVSTFLKDYNIPEEEFHNTIRKQYDKKFGRFGEKVVESNMTVMMEGFDKVYEVKTGKVDDRDDSKFCGDTLLPCNTDELSPSPDESGKAPVYQKETFDKEFRSGLEYDQPSSVLSSVGCMAAGTGATSSKYVARRETPVYIQENCTQCMECIAVCPDTALPNTTQDLQSILKSAIRYYVSDYGSRKILEKSVEEISQRARSKMVALLDDRSDPAHFQDIVRQELEQFKDSNTGVKEESLKEVTDILSIIPLSYKKTTMTFKTMEKKSPGEGGLFSIFVSDLCKGCAACVEACGDHDALRMMPESEDLHAKHLSATEFLKRLPDTDQKFLGKFNSLSPEESKAATLRYHLMMQSKYSALVSGDGACAGCGEKSVLRSVATLTETLMRPIFNNKAERLLAKASDVEQKGAEALAQLKSSQPESYTLLRKCILHLVMGHGGTDAEDTNHRIEQEFKGNDQDLIKALTLVLKIDGENHLHSKLIDGTRQNGMSIMAMTAHTGCNTVYGSTPPNNPHPYPWLNSLFQDGATTGWLVGESFIQNHARRSVIPERLADILISSNPGSIDENTYYTLSHFSDTNMTELEILELPKVWAIGGDGGMGDIGFQNVSKVVLQNRPNVKLLMLDTQVYSNTGGQNSDSSPMMGGADMNSFGEASEGKLTEKKSVSECFMSGHGSPFVAQVSMANAPNLYKALLDGLCYRGTCFIQAFTTCQPEHGVADHLSQAQALLARDSRGIPEFVFNPELGESYGDALNIKANPHRTLDWYQKQIKAGESEKFNYTVAHWAFTEARFRNHHHLASKEEAEQCIPLDQLLLLITMDDVVKRRFLDPEHRSFIPKNGVYVIDYDSEGKEAHHIISRQMVLFCIERRRAWRMLQSKAGILNEDYLKQKDLISKVDQGEITREEVLKPSFST